MPIVVVCRRDIGPTAAGKCAQDTHRCNEARKLRAGLASQQIEEPDKCETRSCFQLANAFAYSRVALSLSSVPDVIAMKIIKKDRSGYRSPMVADTEGNHS